MKTLKILREQKGVKQSDVSKHLGIDRSTYAKYESGASEPNLEMINMMAEYYGVSLNYILTGKNEKTPLVNNDPELTAYLEELRTRPEMRMLFSLTKDATKEDVEQAVRVIEALRKKPADDVDA